MIVYVEKRKHFLTFSFLWDIYLSNNLHDLLIITPPQFTSLLQPLVDHKNNIGTKTKLVELTEINNLWRDTARDIQEAIKYHIKSN